MRSRNKRINIIIVPIVLALMISLPFAIKNRYILGVVEAILINYIYGMAVDLLLGYTGILSFGQAAFYGLGAYVTGYCVSRAGLGAEGLLLSMVLGAVLGFFFGILTLRLTAVYFAITTLGLAEILRVVAQNWMSVTSGPRGLIVKRLPLGLGLDALPYHTVVYLLTLVVAALCLFVVWRLLNSHTGRTLTALRDSEVLVSSIGVSPTLYKTFAFITAAMITALAGGLHALNYGIVMPDLLGIQYTTIGLMVVLLGGKGQLWGPLIGALVYTGCDEGFRALGDFRMVLFALILLLVVVVFPKGLVGSFKSWRLNGLIEKEAMLKQGS